MRMLLDSSKKVLIAGFKDVSLVDVLGSPSFTVWFSYCNFRCPWCQNWPVVTGKEVVEMSIDELVSKIRESAMLVDFLHVTGGEPTLQRKALISLYEKSREIGLRNSLNTNGYNYDVVRELISLELIDHVAMDIKAPLSDPIKYSEVVGLKSNLKIVQNIRKSLESIAERVDLIELRTTFIPMLSKEDLVKIAIEIRDLMNDYGRDDFHYVLQQFIPNSNAPDPRFKSGAVISADDLARIAEELKKEVGLRNVYVRSLEKGLTKI